MRIAKFSRLEQGGLLRQVLLLGTPLLLGILELGHPLLDHDNPVQMLAPIATWWIILHFLLIPLFVLMGVAFFLLLQGIERRAATLSRYAMIVHIAFAIGYDTAVGLNSGILTNEALSQPAAQQSVIQHALQGIYTNPAITLSGYTLLAAGLLAVSAAVWALLRSGVPRLPALILLGMFFSVYSHANPFGPLGSACFFLSALWIVRVWRRANFQGKSRIK